MDIVELHESVEQIVGADKSADVVVSIGLVSIGITVKFYKFKWARRYPRRGERPIQQKAVQDLRRYYADWIGQKLADEASTGQVPIDLGDSTSGHH